jgi:hypothetical protein
MPRTSHLVLSNDQLNRATLARQLLLEPSDLDPAAAIARVGGLQAQEPASPYLALWTRLASFDPASLDRAFHKRRVIKATLMRATLHAVTLEDYLRLLPAVQPLLHRLTRREHEGGPNAARLAELAAAALEFAAQPRGNIDMRDYVASLATELDPDEAWWWVRREAAFVHAPSEVPWSFGRRPALSGAPSWVPGGTFAAEEDALEHLVTRYLGAFGPATAADLSNWSGLPVGRLRPAIEALDARGALRRFADSRGRGLIDVTEAPLPQPDVPAPPRLLPMWDSVLLAHADRNRVLADEHRAAVIGRNGDVLPTFLVHGRVAGLWWAESDGQTTRVVLEPFGRLSRPVRRALEAEGERLAAFVEPHEPAVYARYRRSRARRS